MTILYRNVRSSSMYCTVYVHYAKQILYVYTALYVVQYKVTILFHTLLQCLHSISIISVPSQQALTECEAFLTARSSSDLNVFKFLLVFKCVLIIGTTVDILL